MLLGKPMISLNLKKIGI